MLAKHLRLHLPKLKEPFTVELPHRRVESLGESFTVGGTKAVKYEATSVCVASPDTFVVAVQATHPKMVWDQEEADKLNSTKPLVILQFWQIPEVGAAVNKTSGT